MTVFELEQELRRLRIRADAYSLVGGHPSEAYVLSFDGREWSVYYSERGAESGRRRFGSEDEACTHLLELLKKDSLTKA
jgi:hypothetical protein